MGDAGVAKIDMKLVVVVIPVRMSTARKSFTKGSDGGSKLTAPPARISA